jgi:predicted GTPase
MSLRIEKEGIRFYNYYFHGIEKPITIEARNKQEAREIAKTIMEKLPQKYKDSKIVGETIVIPLVGVSEKVVNGVKHIWVGEQRANGGWLSEQAYKRAIAHMKNSK